MRAPAAMRVELSRSRLAGAFIVVTHLTTAALLAWLPVDASLRALAVICVGAHALWVIRGAALRSWGSAIVAIELAPDGRVVLLRRDGRRIGGRALPESYVGERIATLVVRGDGSRRRHALLLLPDMMAPEELRRFRVLLRLGQPGED